LTLVSVEHKEQIYQCIRDKGRVGFVEIVSWGGNCREAKRISDGLTIIT